MTNRCINCNRSNHKGCLKINCDCKCKDYIVDRASGRLVPGPELQAKLDRRLAETLKEGQTKL